MGHVFNSYVTNYQMLNPSSIPLYPVEIPIYPHNIDDQIPIVDIISH